jgi:hypothetical protein
LEIAGGRGSGGRQVAWNEGGRRMEEVSQIVIPERVFSRLRRFKKKVREFFST